jgi:hypothetical protein
MRIAPPPAPPEPPPPFSAAELRRRALLALEEAVQEARWRRPRRSLALRFALAFLWSSGGGGARGPYLDFWRAIGREDMWRFSASDEALARIYRRLRLRRDEAVATALWERSFREEERGGR